MPGLAQSNDQSSNATSSYYYSPSTRNGSVSSSGFWSKHRDDISYHQLQKFWSDLPPHARRDLLRIDKQSLFEQARKNMYCSRCNGLLLEGFLQIVMYGKSLQQETSSETSCYTSRVKKGQINGVSSDDSASEDEMQDPSVHPWGGLATTRDGALTLLECYLYAKSLKDLQNVFDSSRARERERELLYPDACGGGGRGWISLGLVGYGRGNGTRETCALHTARLSCDTLVDFWSALGEETRLSLLRMKEEDFIERLMYRFDSKRFCRDCRRNVIREFKELKELKRMKREPRCTTWYCVADTTFEYEVSNNTIYADWHQTFIDSVVTYDHYEWAVGTGEGKTDILNFENVGMKESVQVNGLDLSGLNACYITLRACKPDGRCTELSVKAHALKGQHCVHYRLMVGDGYVTISHGESIREFFEHAEEAEEEEDDDSVDKDGNELDSECSRPQKHAKSPELAREFLLDAATVIFKEQVEKAFREGTARQNAHSIFVCLALKLLEERVHVACKEIVTLEKQMKLLAEEEKEKREEEERKEKKRTKEREKKLRRKERLRGKEKEKNCAESNQASSPDVTDKVSSSCMEDQHAGATMKGSADDDSDSSPCVDVQDELTRNDDMSYNDPCNTEEKLVMLIDENDSFTVGSYRFSNRKMKHHRDLQVESSKRCPDRREGLENNSMEYKSDSRYCDDSSDSLNRQPRSNSTKFNSRNPNLRFNLKESKVVDRNDLNSCGCNQLNDYRLKVAPHSVGTRVTRENRFISKIDSPSDVSKAVHRGGKANQSDHVIRDSCGRIRVTSSCSPFGREFVHTKKVWEPVENHKRYPRSNSDSDVTLRSSSCEVVNRTIIDKVGIELHCSEASEKSASNVIVDKKLEASGTSYDSKETGDEENDLHLTRSCKSSGSPNFSASSNSSSDSCSSCLSEGDSNTASSSLPILESSSTSDSEDGSPLSGGRDPNVCIQNSFSVNSCVVPIEKVQVVPDVDKVASKMSTLVSPFENLENRPWSPFMNSSLHDEVHGKAGGSLVQLHQTPFPQISTQQNNIHFPTLQASTTMGYYHQSPPVSWSNGPANGFVPYVHPPNHYLFADPFSYSFSSGDSAFSMQYGTVQHLPSPPMINPSHVPFYQPVFHTNGSHFSDHSSISANKLNRGMDPSCDARKERLVPLGHQSWKAASKLNGVESGMAEFSLFQFGGPLAFSAYNQNSKSSGERVCETAGSDLSPGQTDEGTICCDQKDSNIEEYNLFAASKGIEFSIF